MFTRDFTIEDISGVWRDDATRFLISQEGFDLTFEGLPVAGIDMSPAIEKKDNGKILQLSPDLKVEYHGESTGREYIRVEIRGRCFPKILYRSRY